jgi:glucose-6-phosphate 1-dehydrogenase
LAEGLERLPIHPTALVIFGATGDLARRKLLPALYNLAHEGALPERLEVVGVSRGEMADDEFRAMAAEAIRRFSRRPPDEAVLRALLEDVRYVAGTFDDDSAYAALADALAGLDAHAGRRLNRCFYLSTAPTFFPVIVERLGEHGLNHIDDAEVRIVIEKPFGTTWPRQSSSTGSCSRSSKSARSSASTTTSARRPSRTSSRCASRTACSSRSGTATTSRRSS